MAGTTTVGGSVRTRQTTTLVFALADIYGCRTASVAGDFTAWVPVDMPYNGRHFELTLDVPRHRRWHYQFCLDDVTWINDPGADDYVSLGDGPAVSLRYS